MDLEILQWINANLHTCNFVNVVFKLITLLCEFGWACILLGVVFLLFKKTRKSGLFVLIGIAVGALLVNILIKPLVARPRPFIEDEQFVNFLQNIGYNLPTGYSFPSGHAQVSFNTATMLTLFYKRKGAWAYIPASLIAISRIFLCVHYPTDVLVGAIIGTLSASATFYVGNLIIKKLNSAKRTNRLGTENSGSD